MKLKVNMITLSLVLSSFSYAGAMQIKRFKNCYALFTGERVSANHPLMLKVVNNQITDLNACKELLSYGNLGSDNLIAKNSDGSFKEDSLKVIRNMHLLHKSFFVEPSYLDLSTLSTTGYISEVYDENESAYYWTYSLFQASFTVSEIVKVPYHFDAIRYSTREASRNAINSQTGTSLTIENSWVPSPTLIELGLLTGFRKDSEVFRNTMLQPLFRNQGFENQNANQHFGAGALGSNAYLFANAGRVGFSEISDGGVKVFRRWSKHVLSDFLCRELPALRPDDVTNEVQPESPFPFRNGISCMQCHSSMDPMAANIRNVLAHSTGTTGSIPMSHFKIPVSESALGTLLPIIAPDPDFSKRPPEGRIRYRSYDGTLVEKNTDNLQDLGNFIATTNDLYVCAAKKYYKYLTGIEVDLSDSGSTSSPALNQTETYHRNKVIELGLSLKSHQNLQKLIEDIVKSETFIYPTRLITVN